MSFNTSVCLPSATVSRCSPGSSRISMRTSHIVDAIIGFSVVYKAFDNMDGFKRFLGFQPNTKIAVLIFGLFHGFGLATKLQELRFQRWSHCEYRQLQRWSGDWPVPGADGGAHWLECVADASRISSARIHDEHPAHGGRRRSRGISGHRILGGTIMTNQQTFKCRFRPWRRRRRSQWRLSLLSLLEE